jgi:hypothetical protein
MNQLPRLLFFSDVLAEASYSGSLLVYRLLETYPADRLFVVETSHYLSKPERRLRGVTYTSIDVESPRLTFTRFHQWWHLWMTMRPRSWARKAAANAAAFRPEAVLTVVHGHAWAAAAEYARDAGIPLHLIVHDDWPRMAALPWPFHSRVDRQLAAAYKQAASRLCVSPWMAEEYKKQYGAEGRVIYPSRSVSLPACEAPPPRLLQPQRGLTVVLAGSIRAAEHYRLLGTIARAVRDTGGRVVVYGPATAEEGAANGAAEPNIHFQGMLDFRSLAGRLRDEADVVLVPMSFEAVDAPNMRISFPSKLVDYTALGLPLLIYAPEYASPTRWAREHPGVAEVVSSRSADAVVAALQRLSDPKHRMALASRALEVGTRLFSHEAAWATLTDALAAPARRSHVA